MARNIPYVKAATNPVNSFSPSHHIKGSSLHSCKSSSLNRLTGSEGAKKSRDKSNNLHLTPLFSPNSKPELAGSLLHGLELKKSFEDSTRLRNLLNSVRETTNSHRFQRAKRCPGLIKQNPGETKNHKYESRKTYKCQ
jgi:hypothetical protein